MQNADDVDGNAWNLVLGIWCFVLGGWNVTNLSDQTPVMEILIHILGWTGSIMVIAAYGLNSYQRMASDSMMFLLLNTIGGALLILYSAYLSAFANTFINVVWVIIAIPALVKKLVKAN